MGTTESSLYAPSPQDPARRHSFPSPSASVGSSNSPRRSIRRARPANVVTLNGLVLGLTGSGRRTLLQRLEGKDPFVNDERSNDNKDPPRDVTVPYQPPPYATVYDRIQLHVEMKPNEDVSADFCVVLINPQHSAKNLRPYIAKLVSLLIPQTAKRPLCLCFLLNFRDLQGDRYTRIQCQDVEEWVRDILQQHDKEQQRIILQCTSTSLKNCFGLSELHHFIYRSYLVHKQVELEQRLGDVQKALVDSEQQVPTMAYDDFLQVLKQATTESAKESSERQAKGTNERTVDSSDDNGKNDAVDRTVEEGKRDKKKHEEKGGRQSQVNRIRNEKALEPSRSILPKTYTDPKQTLDAFFADDDEEEDIVTPVTSHHARNKHVSDEDDDDDDFFYDEGGHRHQHGVVVMDSSSDTDDEEATVESLDSQLAHAREHSIIDSDDSDIDEPAKVEISDSKPMTSDTSVKEMVKVDDKPADDELPTNNEDDIQENVVDGWGDDGDIDFSDDDNNDYDKERVSATDEDVKEEIAKKEEVDGDAEGSSDNIEDDTEQDELADTLANGSKPSHADQIMSADETKSEKAEIVESAIESPEEPVDSSSREADSDRGANGEPIHTKQRDSSTSSPSPSERAAEEANSDEPELEKAVERATETVGTKVTYLPADDDESSDDDDYVVENTTPSSPVFSPKPQSRPQPAVQEPSSPPASPSSPSSSGISAAALAAIAAAEREAQLMVQEQMKDETPSKSEDKKVKKKKDPEAKKKKKKHKEKRRSRVSE